MEKKIFTIILLIFLSSCGYEAIHSKKNVINYNFSIKEINFSGDRYVNLKIKEKLNNYISNKKDKDFILKISTTSNKVISSKNISGNATSYKNTITVNVETLMNNKIKKSFKIVESFNYNNDSNKINLKKYEKEIIRNLSETAVSNIIFKLSKIQ
jgi:outer membrane lipopolysaccharide assembly protein LptE/RlpB